ncbi:UNVERIFIED_CONTAM: hypothetical protein GTU68_003122 [Idotea baltica]|nr:hypothetical protein [Idotea baltica]
MIFLMLVSQHINLQ